MKENVFILLSKDVVVGATRSKKVADEHKQEGGSIVHTELILHSRRPNRKRKS
jgi:hypothetical protein